MIKVFKQEKEDSDESLSITLSQTKVTENVIHIFNNINLTKMLFFEHIFFLHDQSIQTPTENELLLKNGSKSNKKQILPKSPLPEEETNETKKSLKRSIVHSNSSSFQVPDKVDKKM